jgi:hypothetical protein
MDGSIVYSLHTVKSNISFMFYLCPNHNFLSHESLVFMVGEILASIWPVLSEIKGTCITLNFKLVMVLQM